MKKLLPKRKPERKPSDEEFALRKSESVCVKIQVCLTQAQHSVYGIGRWLLKDFRRKSGSEP